MNLDETRQLLRTRSGYTSQPYSDDVIAAWHDALEHWTYDDCRTALVKASREHQKIAVAHLVDLLPPLIRTPTTPLDKCELCDDTGWVDDPSYHSKRCPRTTKDCPCHGVKPCRCTRGRQMVETQRRIYETNNR